MGLTSAHAGTVVAPAATGIIDPRTGKPVGAALSSFVAFGVGALVPLIPWFFTEGTAAILASAIIGFLAAAAVGLILAGFTERSYFRTALRQVTWAVVARPAPTASTIWRPWHSLRCA